MTDDGRSEFLERTADYWQCPNDGRILIGVQHDDKVLCGCGRPNPACARQESKAIPSTDFGVHYDFIGAHIKSYLKRATLDEALAMLTKRDAEWASHHGIWAPDDIRRAFVAGAAWWEAAKTGFTMWASDRTLAEAEADRRYPEGKVRDGR